MSTLRRWPFRPATQSLGQQISLAETRLDARRGRVKALTRSLDTRVRGAGISPGGLWLAGCAGFVFSEWLNRPKSNARRHVPPPSAPVRQQQTPDPSNVAVLIEFALDIGMAWARIRRSRSKVDIQ